MYFKIIKKIFKQYTGFLWLSTVLSLIACSHSGMLEDLEDLSGGARFFLTPTTYQGNFAISIGSTHTECFGLTDPAELANCACLASAFALAVTMPEKFRAVISTNERHFACNLINKNGSYCDYKIRPGRRLYEVNNCPLGSNCSDANPAVTNLAVLLEQFPQYPFVFMAGFDGSKKTGANCLNFTSNNPLDNVLLWDNTNLPWPGGANVSCQVGGPILCLDHY